MIWIFLAKNIGNVLCVCGRGRVNLLIDSQTREPINGIAILGLKWNILVGVRFLKNFF